MAKIADLLERIGANPGSLRQAYVGAPGTAKCMVCNQRTTMRWWIKSSDKDGVKEVFKKVLLRRWQSEPATMGPDLEPKKKPKEELPTTDWENRKQTTPEDRRKRYEARSLGAVGAIVQPPTAEEARLQGARAAAERELHKWGVAACFECAREVCQQDIADVTREWGEKHLSERNIRAFQTLVDYANHGRTEEKNLPKASTSDERDPDMYGRGPRELGLIEQVISLKADEVGRVITVAPQNEGGKLFAYVRRRGQERAKGVEGCIVMPIAKAVAALERRHRLFNKKPELNDKKRELEDKRPEEYDKPENC
jgi:hypothetical protein